MKCLFCNKEIENKAELVQWYTAGYAGKWNSAHHYCMHLAADYRRNYEGDTASSVDVML